MAMAGTKDCAGCCECFAFGACCGGLLRLAETEQICACGKFCGNILDKSPAKLFDEEQDLVLVNDQAYARRPRGCGTVRPSSLAVEIHS